MGQRATLGGQLLIGTADITWTIMHGVKPHMAIFEMSNESADAILNGAIGQSTPGKKGTPGTGGAGSGAGGVFATQTRGSPGTDGVGATSAGPLELIVTSDARPPLRVQGLYFVHKMPTADPYRAAVLVADRRWLWTRKHVTRRYNMRRRTGDKRLIEGEVIQLDQFTDDVAYVPGSLKDETSPWTAQDIFKDIFEELGESFTFASTLEDAASIEDLEIDFDGAEALQAAVSKIPGASIWLDAAGKVFVGDVRDGTESEMLAFTGTAKSSGGGRVIFQDNTMYRPSSIDFLFTPAFEVRFDFIENGTQLRDGRWMKMVCQLPDRSTTIAGKRYGATSYVAFNSDLYDAWGTGPGDIPKLSDTIIKRDLPWGMLELTYGQLGENLTPDEDWQGRIHSVISNYYQTYQLNRLWVDRAISIEARRVALLDPENGTYSRASVYTDYTVWPSVKGMLKDKTKATVMYNRHGYADLLENGSAAPVGLKIEDEQVGVIRANFIDHPLGWVQRYLPAAMKNIPSFDVSSKSNRVDKRDKDATKVFSFEDYHKMAIVVTIVPAWPNNNGRLYKITKTADEIAKSLSGTTEAPKALGPPIQVRVPPQFQARFAWMDSYATQIEQAFGFSGGKGLTDALKPLLVNGDEVEAIALAMGQALYNPLRDRVTGSVTTEVDPRILPKGSITQVSHTLADGRTQTFVQLDTEGPPIDWMAKLPDRIRRVILHQVQVNR